MRQDEVLGAGAGAEHGADGHEQVVADPKAVPALQVAEVVDVDEHERERTAVAPRALRLLGEAPAEVAQAEAARQRIGAPLALALAGVLELGDAPVGLGELTGQSVAFYPVEHRSHHRQVDRRTGMVSSVEAPP